MIDVPDEPMVDVSVSIVVFRSPISEVVQAVESVAAEALDTDLQVIDNESGQTYFDELVAALAGKATVVASGRNGGYGYGHNTALRTARTSRHHLVLNPDVVIRPGALVQLVGFLDSRPYAGMVAPKVLNPDGTLQALNKRDPNVLDLVLRRFAVSSLRNLPFFKHRLDRYEMWDVGYDRTAPLEFMSGCCMLIRRDLLASLGGFDDRFFLYFEDADLTRRVNQVSSSWYLPDAVVTHVWHRDSARSWWAFRVLVTSAVSYFRKWGLRLW